jgi:hypothetical protein
MKKKNLFFGLIVLVFTACNQNNGWIDLIGKNNLDNWEMSIGKALSGLEADSAGVTTEDIFSLTQMDGFNALHINGPVNAAIATKEDYRNYHLQMEFKWGEKVYTSLNSGLLYHCYGPYGPGLGTWMSGHEFQLWTDNLGDSYRMGETYCTSRVVPGEDNNHFKYDPKGKMTAFGKNEVSKIIRKSKNAENPVGEWNMLDLYCVADTAVHVVNGEVVMVTYNSSRYQNGDVVPLMSGKIQFQAEGGELFIRKLRLRNISFIPQSLVR